MDQVDYLFPSESRRGIASQDLSSMLEHCVVHHASDITIQSTYPIMAEIYGKLYPITKQKLNNTEVSLLLNHIYGPNGTTQLLSGHDLDSYFEIKPDRFQRYRFRVNGTACFTDGHESIQITLRHIPTTPPNLADMALPEPLIQAMQPHDGVVYVTGATGSGKSTLLASMIKHIAEDPQCHRKILTYESPIEFVYDEIKQVSAVISQSEIPRHLPSFSAGVRNALRRKPRLIMVGESRDQETMAAVLEAALTGHPVYTTLHTNGVAETVRRLVATFPSEERRGRTIDIIETIRAIVWQRLVPTVDDKRVALREYLIFDELIRDQLLDHDPNQVTQVTRHLLHQYGQPMHVDALAKFKSGQISQRTYDLIAKDSQRKQGK
jgi:defect-in-organelle-trafficking protein DotB